jgi:hypothetical protein
MSTDDDDNDIERFAATDDDEHDNTGNTSSEAAGVVRGLSRSIKGVLRFPAVGRLPRQVVKQRRLPVRQIAKASDRLSQGLDVLFEAVDATGETRRTRFTNFLFSVTKNTILGAAVFETYEYTVANLAPSPTRQDIVHDNEDESGFKKLEHDVYARASLSTHYFAGACGGSVHAVASTFWESIWNPRLMQTLPAMTIHHAIAHSTLFGCYETCKRALLTNIMSERHDEIPYFASVTFAGGIAGSIQHIISTYTEQWFRIENVQETPKPFTRHMIRIYAVPPTIRSIVYAFPPSAISFVAFEYGKSLLS